jgi:hypothetical protein
MQARERGKDSCRAARNQLPMTEHEARRTLVKSTPELWAECSDAASLARHLGAFGEIRITKLEPETAVAWEGEDVRGTVTLEPSGWGTRVILTAIPEPGVGDAPALAADAPSETWLPEPVLPESAPVLPKPSQPVEDAEAPGSDESAGMPRPGFWRRLFAGWRRAAPPLGAESESESVARPEVSAPPEAAEEAEKSVAVAPPARPARPEPVTPPSHPAAAALTQALDSLGRAHHRPYSRG